MFEQHVVVFEHAEYAARKAEFGVHQLLFDEDDAVSLLACNAGDVGILLVVVLDLGDDHRAGSGRVEGVADVDGDVLLSDGEDRLGMQHVCAHVGKLAQLLVRDLVDDARAFHNARIGGHKAVDVRPILIYRRVYCARDDGTGDVRTAPAERVYAARRVRAVKAGNDRLGRTRKALRRPLVGLFGFEHAVVVKDDDLGGVDKLAAELFGKHDRAEIFASARAIVDRVCRGHLLFDLVENGLDVEIKPEILDDLDISLPDLRERGGALAVDLEVVIACVKHVRDLGVARGSLARSGHDHIVAFGIGCDDLGDLFDRRRVRHRRSAELDYLLCHFSLLKIYCKAHLILRASQ